jgi:hypothetical protein
VVGGDVACQVVTADLESHAAWRGHACPSGRPLAVRRFTAESKAFIFVSKNLVNNKMRPVRINRRQPNGLTYLLSTLPALGVKFWRASLLPPEFGHAPVPIFLGTPADQCSVPMQAAYKSGWRASAMGTKNPLLPPTTTKSFPPSDSMAPPTTASGP